MKLVPLIACLSVPAVAQEPSPPPVEEQDDQRDVTLFAGSDYISGDVDGQDYETVALSTGLTARSGRFSFTASIPYVVTSAPEELIVGNGGLLGTPLFSQPSTQTRRVTREGIGDLALQGGYRFPLGSANAFIAGNVKVPTASREKALGTGELDYGVSGQVSRQFGRAIPFVTANYTVIGEPEPFDVRNTLGAGVGSQFLLSNSSFVTLSYNYEQSATQSIEDRQSIGIGLETGFASRFKLGFDARAGLSADAPDARAGVQIGMEF